MYSGSDLDTLMTALGTLTESGFLQYDFNVGQTNPHLSITVSAAIQAEYPVLVRLPQSPQVINLYYTTDFTPPVATFISNMNAGVAATVTANATLLSQVSTAMAAWPNFVTAYNSFG